MSSRGRRSGGLQRRRAMYGRLFILPWIIGFVFFFFLPFIQSVYYTLTKITITADGLTFSFVGLENYIFALTKDPDFVRTIVTAITNIMYQVPIIVFFSVFVAIVLKGRFLGRSVMRAIFFFPVIISAGVVITILRENVMLDPAAAAAGAQGSLFQAGNIRVLLANAGLGLGFSRALVDAITRIFDLTWKSGVQTLLLLAALHAVPESMYEAANIEGATGWERFWKITFPLISPTMVLAVIYSVIDYFTDYANGVMRMIVQYTSQGRFEYSTTVGISYFTVVLALILVVNAVLSRRAFYMNE